MLTLPTIIGLIWLAASLIGLFAIPFLVLIYLIRKKYSYTVIIFTEILILILIFAFIYLVFGGLWFFIGILAPTLTMG